MYFLLSGRHPFRANSIEALKQVIMRGVVYFDGLEWDRISRDAQILVKNMLQYKPSIKNLINFFIADLRPDAHYCVRDAWFKKMKQKDLTVSAGSSVLENL